MSDLLLQTIVERLEAIGVLLQAMSNDADKAQIELRKKLVDISTEILRLSPNTGVKEVKQLTLAVESLKASIPKPSPVQKPKHFLLRKQTWFAAVAMVIFLAMAWGWGYTFRALTESESDAHKYRYIKSIANPTLSRFYHQVDSVWIVDPSQITDTKPGLFAGEKEKVKPRSSSPTR